MKKSNALMLSYIIFLIIAVVAKVRYDWCGIEQIALAATIAGCFFAFADLANWYISDQKPIVEALREDFDLLGKYCEVAQTYLDSDVKEAHDIIEQLQPYSSRDEKAERVINACKEALPYLKSRANGLTEAVGDTNNLEKSIKREELKITVVSVTELILAILGFISFFTLISFTVVVDFFTSYGSIATVIAFALIMLTYFLRDVLGDNAKRDVEEIRLHIEEQKKDIGDVEAKAKETHKLDVVKKYIERLKTMQPEEEV